MLAGGKEILTWIYQRNNSHSHMCAYIYRIRCRNICSKQLWHVLLSGFAGHRLEMKDGEKQHGASFWKSTAVIL